MSPVHFSSMLILVSKVKMLLDMTRAEKRLFDLGSEHKLLFFWSISNGFGADSNIGDILKLLLQLSSSISFACGDKLHQLTAIVVREYSRTTTSIFFKSASDLRAIFRDSRMTNTKFGCNLTTGVTILQHKNDGLSSFSRKGFHDARIGLDDGG